MTAPHEPADQTPEHGAAADAAPAAQDDLLAELNELRANWTPPRPPSMNSMTSCCACARKPRTCAAAPRKTCPRPASSASSRSPRAWFRSGQPGSRAGPARTDRGHSARRRGSDPEAAGRRLRAQPAQGNRAGPGRQVRSAPAPGDFVGAGRSARQHRLQLLQKGYAIADRTLRPALVVVSAGQG